jgi:hypothetical protein
MATEGGRQGRMGVRIEGSQGSQKAVDLRST